MAGSKLRNSIAVLGLVAATATTTYVLSDDESLTANAAQTGGRGAVAQRLMSGPCWHVGLSDWHCPDSTMMVSRPDYVTSVSMTVEYSDGKRTTLKLPTAGVDAIFLTKDATEKFLLPYYWATNKEKAQAVERKLTALRDAQR